MEPTGGSAVPAVDLEKSQQVEIELLDGRYEILELLGQGGMGTVIKARHARLHKLVAIKVLNAGLVNDENKARFEVEAKAGSKLSHPNLVSVFDYGFTRGDEPYLVMEYVEGQSLDRLLSEKGVLTTAELLHIFIQVAKALNHIHENGIVHRDLKASNIMLHVIGSDQYAKVLDFGIAKVFDGGEAMQKLTATGVVLGSPLYMSPEHCRGAKTDARSDVYSLGCVMYECLSGAPPFCGENPLQTLFKHISDEVPMAPYKTNADYNLALVVHKCMQKSPDDRFQTAEELAVALNSISATLQYESAKLADPRELLKPSPQPITMQIAKQAQPELAPEQRFVGQTGSQRAANEHAELISGGITGSAMPGRYPPTVPDKSSAPVGRFSASRNAPDWRDSTTLPIANDQRSNTWLPIVLALAAIALALGAGCWYLYGRSSATITSTIQPQSSAPDRRAQALTQALKSNNSQVNQVMQSMPKQFQQVSQSPTAQVQSPAADSNPPAQMPSPPNPPAISAGQQVVQGQYPPVSPPVASQLQQPIVLQPNATPNQPVADPDIPRDLPQGVQNTMQGISALRQILPPAPGQLTFAEEKEARAPLVEEQKRFNAQFAAQNKINNDRILRQMQQLNQRP